MNSRRSFIVGVAFVTLLIFTGCQAEESTNTTVNPPADNKGTSVVQRAPGQPVSTEESLSQERANGKIPPRTELPANALTMQLTGGEPAFQGTVPTQQSTYSEADMSAYNDAVRLRDATKCSQIQDETLKTKCTTDVNDAKIIDDALANKDKTLCQKLSTSELKQKCESEINAMMSGQTAGDEAALRDQIIASGDYTRCSKELTTDGAKFECEVSILSQKAASTGDASWCQKGSTADIIKACNDSLIKK